MAFPRPSGGSSSFHQTEVAFQASHPRPFPPTRGPFTSPPSSWHAPSALEINASRISQPFVDAQFDIFDWHIQYQSCLRYFLDHAQYAGPVQAVAAFVNIQLPFQKPHHPILSSQSSRSPPGPSIPGVGPSGVPGPGLSLGSLPSPPQPLPHVSLLPYIRRLVATGFDFPGVLHGFFGDDWVAGVGQMHESERRNYLFAAKSDNWLKVKADYDMGDDQTIPFLRPLQNASEKEIEAAEAKWSEWLAMQDWMLGPRAPIEVTAGGVSTGGGGGSGGRGGGNGGMHGGIGIKTERE